MAIHHGNKEIFTGKAGPAGGKPIGLRVQEKINGQNSPAPPRLGVAAMLEKRPSQRRNGFGRGWRWSPGVRRGITPQKAPMASVR